MLTPWGKSDSIENIAPGIAFYSTPGHGGFLISQDRRDDMPEAIRQFQTFAGGNWYEEDCDAALVVFSFPTLFSFAQINAARRTIAYYHPELLHEWSRARFTGTITCARCGLLPLDQSDYELPCEKG